MRRALFLAAISLSLLPFSCNDVTPPETAGFVFRVTVQDSRGKPVPGVTVAAWSKLLGITPMKAAARGGARVEATTQFLCDVARRCRLTLTVKDLEGRRLLTLLDQHEAPAGRHAIIWGVPAARYTAYRCHLVAQDSAGGVLYRDSIVASSWNPEITASTLGLTSGDGLFETDSRVLFPGLFDLGRFVTTSVDGESTGTFVWSDTTVITLSSLSGSATYERVLTAGANSFTFTWPPIPPPYAVPPSPPPEPARTPALAAPAEVDSVPVVPPLRFRLYQNVPNPFD